MRIEEMITNKSSTQLLDKLSLSASLEVYGEQYGEYAYWFKGVKVLGLTLYTLTQVCTFSTLFSIHFPSCWQGELFNNQEPP